MDFHGDSLDERVFSEEPKCLCQSGLTCCRGKEGGGPGTAMSDTKDGATVRIITPPASSPSKL